MLKRLLLLVFTAFLANALTAQNARLVLPIAHTAEVNSASYSADGKFIVTASEDRSVKIFETSTGRELLSLSEINAPVKKAVFSPDGKQVLLYYYGVAVIYEIPSGKKQHVLKGHTAGINHIAYSQDGRYCLTACDDKALRIYNPKTGELLYTLGEHSEAVKYAEFSSDSKRVVSAGWDHLAMVYDLESGKLLQQLAGHEGNLNTVHFNKDGSKVLTSSWDKTAKLYDAKTGKLLQSFGGHEKTVVDARFNKDGTRVATLSMDGHVRLFSAGNAQLISSRKHAGEATCIQFSQNGRWLYSGDKTGELLIFDLENDKKLPAVMAHKGAIQAMDIHPRLPQFITSSSDYSIHSYLEDGSLMYSIAGKTEPISDFVFSPNGKWMAAIYQDSIVRVIAVESGIEHNRFIPGGTLHSLSFDPASHLLATAGGNAVLQVFELDRNLNTLQLKLGHGQAIRHVQWTSDGKQLLTAGEASYTSLIDYQSGKVLRELGGHNGPIIALARSEKGSYALSTGADSTVRVYDLTTGKTIHTYTGFRQKLNLAAFSPDALKFAYCEGFTIYVHETLSGKLLHTLKQHTWHVHDMAFSPDNRFLLSGAADRKAILYDVENGRAVHVIEATGAPVYSVSFNRLGDYFALAGGDQLVHVYETVSGKEKFALEGHFAPLRKVSFSPDGVHLLSVGRGHQAVLWDFNTGKQMYSRLQLQGDDWLLYDSDFRYDGSTGARNTLYVSCGLETIQLDRLKDALFVPGLAQKQFYRQEIDFPKLSDLNLCGTLPEVKPNSIQQGNIQFQINQRGAEVQEVEVYVNHRLTKTIPKSSLKTVDGQLMLDLPGQELQPLLSANDPNEIEVVAVTSTGGKDLKSRGVIELPGQASPGSKTIPNVYAVMIGINAYKDPSLKLNYPVTDAKALGNVIEMTAGEFLGPEHIFMYHINSEVRGGNGYATPERDNIRRAFADIGERARPEDVVLIFFAGHGMMKGLVDQKFTLLTAEATKENPVGISTTDLQSWLSPEGPHKMKANKMILIFDACHSGQASKELFTMMSYNEDRTNRIRQMEDLREKSGLLIMAASAPNQAAYELPQYGQGLLTYCLLKTLKNNPDVLDDREFVNVTKWFLESERELQRVMESLGKNQDAQPFGTSNLRIGIVNDSIRNAIKIAEDKPLLFCQSAENTQTFGDDLRFQEKLNRALEIRARGEDAKIGYVSRQTSVAHSVKVKYSVKRGKVKCHVILLKNNMPYFQQELSGEEDDLDRLAVQIVRLVEANVHQ